MIALELRLFWVSGVFGSKKGGQRRILGVNLVSGGFVSVTAREPALQTGVLRQVTMNVYCDPAFSGGLLFF